MKIVLDTNVLVSGLLSPFGYPARILGLAISGELVLCLDARIITEYTVVLRRPRFQFDQRKINLLLEQIEAEGIWVASKPLRRSLPDPDDEAFLEVAVAANVDCLVTGNLIHFPVSLRQDMKVFSPKEFITFYRKMQG